MKSSFSTQDCCNTVGLLNEANISYPKPVLRNQHTTCHLGHTIHLSGITTIDRTKQH
ncbi:hypothetical protein ACR777_00905 [Sphingobacterium spiritivorum]|uniref:hypothetical protein n=1 Tax=Sphingobacterium spiritivorum TaxID=258 RepID=UPI003DA48B0A